MSKNEEKVKWHRLGGMVLTPLFNLLGYATELEVDLSLKQQLLDILVVERDKIQPEKLHLPKIYWEAFDDFNEHNLISFKSFHESFNGFALMEFFGHVVNYNKSKEVPLDKINLYAISHHYPRDLFNPFEGTEFLKVIKKDEIFELSLSTTKSVRFIILRTTNNPLLALFSNNPPKIAEGYQRLTQETDFLEGISIYFSKIAEYYGEEVKNMYTKEDFWRDYPPNDNPFVWPWLKDYHEQELQKAVAREARQEKMETAKTLLTMGMDVSQIAQATRLSEQQILSLKAESMI